MRISILTVVNNEIALEIDNKYIYQGELSNKQEPDGIGRLTIKDGGLFYKGYFDMTILQKKIDELKKLAPICEFCFDKGKVECPNCRGELIYDTNESKTLICGYCEGTGLIKCPDC
jgi:hypothetical protein